MDDRLGEVERLQDDRVAGVAERVTSGRVLQADEGDDVAGVGRFAWLAVVGVHLDDAADALLAVARRVEDRVALGEPCPSTRGRTRACRGAGRT